MSLDGRLETKKRETSFEKNVERPVSGTNSFFDSASSRCSILNDFKSVPLTPN